MAQSLARQRNLRNPYGIAHALVALAMNAFAGGDRAKAREHVREAMTLAAPLHDVDISMMALETAAYVAADEAPSLARSWLSTLESARERYGRALLHDLGRRGAQALDDALREALGAPGDRAARVRGRISPSRTQSPKPQRRCRCPSSGRPSDICGISSDVGSASD